MMQSRLRPLASLVPLILIAGCAAPPPARLYVLGDQTASAPVAIIQSGRPVIELFRVSVPDYLDTQDILISSGRNEVKASPTGRWAERLSVGVTQALAADLTASLPGAVIITDQPIVPPAQQIMVDVQAFEIGADGQCLLIAQWMLASGNGGPVLRMERDSYVEQAADTGDAAIAAAMSRAIDWLVTRIAAAMPDQDYANAGSDEASVAQKVRSSRRSERPS